jgi:hypothetical protein
MMGILELHDGNLRVHPFISLCADWCLGRRQGLSIWFCLQVPWGQSRRSITGCSGTSPLFFSTFLWVYIWFFFPEVSNVKQFLVTSWGACGIRVPAISSVATVLFPQWKLSVFLSGAPRLRWCLAKRSRGYGAGTCSRILLLVFFRWWSWSSSIQTHTSGR